MATKKLHRVSLGGSKSGARKNVFNIFGSPSNGTWAEYILFKNYLRELEFNSLVDALDLPDFKIRVKPNMSDKQVNHLIQMVYNAKFIKDMEKEYGHLTCVYCPSKLKLYPPSNDVGRAKDMATCDHFLPKSKFGDSLNFDNMVVACTTCNEKKDNQIYSLDKLINIHLYHNHPLAIKKANQ